MTTDEIKNLVVEYAAACGVSPSVAYFQIQRESSFNPNARGAAGEKGIAQFMAATWKDFGQGAHDNAFDPRYAMNAYCRYMQYLLGLFGNDYEKALQGYNGGPGNVQKGTVSSAAKAYAREILAQAGAQPNIGVIEVSAGGSGSGQFPVWLIIGAAGLLIWFAFSD